jgi:hypothetical protein
VPDSYSPGQGVSTIFSNTSNLPQQAANLAVTANTHTPQPQTSNAPMQPPVATVRHEPPQQAGVGQQPPQAMPSVIENPELSKERFTVEGFYEYLNGFDTIPDDLGESEMSRGQAVQYDQRTAKYRPNRPIYVYNNTESPLIIDDLSLQFHPKQVINISGKPASVLRNSGQLRNCLARNYIVLVSEHQAKELSETFDKRQNGISGRGELPVYDSIEQAADSAPVGYDPMVDNYEDEEDIYLENLTGNSGSQPPPQIKTEVVNNGERRTTRRSY